MSLTKSEKVGVGSSVVLFLGGVVALVLLASPKGDSSSKIGSGVGLILGSILALATTIDNIKIRRAEEAKQASLLQEMRAIEVEKNDSEPDPDASSAPKR